LMHLPPTRGRTIKRVLDESGHLDFVSETALMARPRSGASKLTAPDRHCGANQATLAARDG